MYRADLSRVRDTGDVVDTQTGSNFSWLTRLLGKYFNDTKLKAITASVSGFQQNDWLLLTKLINDYDAGGCVQHTIYSFLQQNGVRFVWRIRGNLPDNAPAAYSPNDVSVNFSTGSSIVLGNFRHEIYHAFQDRKMGIGQYSGFRTNIEYETFLFLDIHGYMNGYGTSSRLVNINSNYNAWLIQMTSGSTFPSYQAITQRYWEFIEPWKAAYSGTNYNTPISRNITPHALFSLSYSGCNK